MSGTGCVCPRAGTNGSLIESGLKSSRHMGFGATMKLESKARKQLSWQEPREHNYCRISQRKGIIKKKIITTGGQGERMRSAYT